MIVGRPLIRVAETSSTMDLASRLADRGATAGTTVLAGHQTAGRGRAGRMWTTTPGSSILMSFVAHTSRERRTVGALSLLLGLAVSQTVDHFTDMASVIKWPNDVLVDGRKIAGILVTSRALPHSDHLSLIAGIGLNVNDHVSRMPETATSLAQVSATSPPFEDVLSTLLGNLNVVMERFETGDTDELWKEAGKRFAFRGELVRIEDGPRIYEGILLDVSEDGLLRLQLPTGPTINVAAGDLTRGPIAIP